MALVQHGGVENFRDAGGAGCTVRLNAVGSSQEVGPPLSVGPAATPHTLSASDIATHGLPTPTAVTCVTEKDGMVTIVGSSDSGLALGGRSLKMAVDRNTQFVYSVRYDRFNPAKRLHGVQGTYFDLNVFRRDFIQALHEADILPESISDANSRLSIGYIRPGHGAKGQKVSLVDESDLATMYEVCRVRRDVMLWFSVPKDIDRPAGMYLPRSKGKTTSSPSAGNTPNLRPKKRAKVVSAKVDAAITTASNISGTVGHVEVEMVPQTNNSGVQMNWPVSMVTDLVSQPTEALAISTPLSTRSSLVSSMAPSSIPASTMERAHTRKMLIEQLRMWFDLYNAGAVLAGDYEYHRQKILQDMTNL